MILEQGFDVLHCLGGDDVLEQVILFEGFGELAEYLDVRFSVGGAECQDEVDGSLSSLPNSTGSASFTAAMPTLIAPSSGRAWGMAMPGS